jgi:SAM-dependent methyltransferase
MKTMLCSLCGCLYLLLCLGLPVYADGVEAAPTIASPYEVRSLHHPDGIGKFYQGREIAQVMGHPGAGWLERPTRDWEERPNKAIAALPWRSTDVVADIGAGSGFFSFRIAPKVAKVYAVDIQPEMLALIEAKQVENGINNVEPILGTVTAPNLPDNSLDWAIMVDAYHEFAYPQEMMLALKAAMKPGGKIVLLEYKGENPLIAIKALHKMTQTQVRAELEAIGLKFVENKRVLPQQHLLIFQKI